MLESLSYAITDNR